MEGKLYKDISDSVVEQVKNRGIENITCDRCGSSEITEITYGLPAWIVIDDDCETDARIKSLIDEEKIVLGGCCIDINSPKYYCRKCSNKFGLIKME